MTSVRVYVAIVAGVVALDQTPLSQGRKPFFQ